VLKKIMMNNARIIADPKVAAGKPLIQGTRLTLEFVLDLMFQGWTAAAILRNYPGLTRKDILACLQYARDVLRSEKVYSLAAAE
jgi:uncharacterized protein (DUF433 family)